MIIVQNQMLFELEKYLSKLVLEGVAESSSSAAAATDGDSVTAGEEKLAAIASEIISINGFASLFIVKPVVLFTDLIFSRACSPVVIPVDSETRTFLHDIPLVSKKEFESSPIEISSSILAQRKGFLVEGVGIIASGALTVEQGYINASSLFHSLFIHYLAFVANADVLLTEENQTVAKVLSLWGGSVELEEDNKVDVKLIDYDAFVEEMKNYGKLTVQKGLVDSAFGNISCRIGNIVYISQTGASLDSLQGCIDQVLLDNSSTSGITASSEFPAHRSIYALSDFSSILHGHPKFTVIMTLLCGKRSSCSIDCWSGCSEKRMIGEFPVVTGETGIGGLAESVAPAVRDFGGAVVYGHGFFCAGNTGFSSIFNKMAELENLCRRSYRELLCSKHRFDSNLF